MRLHPLQQRVQTVVAKGRRLQLLYGAAAVAATFLAALVVWGVIDAALHVGETGVRVIGALSILLLTILTTWRVAWPAWRHRLHPLGVAQRIEARFPQLGDRLSASLAFLAQDEQDELGGSAALRRAMIAETVSHSEGLDFREALDARPTYRMLAVAAAATLVTALLAAVFPAAAQLVVIRTFAPWADAPWPRRHQLQVAAAPERIATGADFEVAVTDVGGKLPDQVTIVYEFAGDRADQAQRREMKLLGGKMVHRLEGVTRSFRYRAVGGDDDTMPWRELQVVEPPAIAALEVKVIPPAYTSWPTERTTPDFRALAGSRIELLGQVDKPIQSAALVLEGSEAAPDSPIAIGKDGLAFALPADPAKPWVLSTANGYALDLTSAEGFTTRSARYDLRVVADHAPAVVVEEPADNASVTASAVLPLRVLVKDDLAIHRIELKYLRSDATDAGETTIELYAGPSTVAPVEASPLKEAMPPGESRLVEFAWNLGDLKDLQPGVTLTWHVAALDYKPQPGVSPAQRLTIISPEELEDRIAQRQNAILLHLQETLRKEQKARSDVAALQTQLDSVGRLGKQDLDQLQSIELQQREVQRSLLAQPAGASGQIRQLLSELESNRVDSPEITRRMRALLDEFDRLSKEALPSTERSLVGALKLVRDDIDKHGDVKADNVVSVDATTKASIGQSLADSGAGQDEVISTLERVLEDLEQWDSYRRFAREVSRLRGDQQALGKETSELQPKTLSKPLRDLSPQELAALRRVAQKQTELARQLDKLVARMNEASTKLAESQPLAASTLADALDATRRSAISSSMLDAARSIQQNQLGNAGQQQQDLAESLSELQDILSSRKEHELGRRIKQLRESAGELAALEQQLKGLKQRAKEAAKLTNEAERKRQLERLSKVQRRVQEEAKRLARRLERLQSEKAGQQLSQGGDKAGAASDASQSGDASSALEDLTAAEKHLEDAQRQLEQDIAQAEQDLFFEQVAKLEQAIQGLVERQQTVIAETIRLDDLKTNQEGEWTPSQRTSVRSLTEQQRDLVSETSAFAQKLKEAAAFRLALEGAVREMTRAAARLDRLLTDAETQAAENVALARLQQLLTALKPDEPSDDMPPQPMENGQPNNQPQLPPGEAVNLLAELKLLRLMQVEINRRTAELQRLRTGGGALRPEQEREVSDLADEQGKLADLVQTLSEKLSKRAAEAAQEDITPPPGAQPPDAGNNPLDEELNKSLDNEPLR